MAKRIELCSTADVAPGNVIKVEKDDLVLAVYNLDGEFYALKNSCPHQAARVCLGRVLGTTLPSDVYEFQYGKEGRILRCPWHSWEYDITTGQSVFDPRVRVVTYPVEIANFEVAITVS